MGHILSKDGIQPDPSNVESVNRWSSLTNKKQVKRFLGAISYYHRFIEKFSARSEHLRLLLGDVEVYCQFGLNLLTPERCYSPQLMCCERVCCCEAVYNR